MQRAAIPFLLLKLSVLPTRRHLRLSRKRLTGVYRQCARTGGSSGTPAYTEEDISPYDFATIYNILPLWNKGIDGTGQTIAIAGTSDISQNDISTFRTFFGLPPISRPTRRKWFTQPQPSGGDDPEFAQAQQVQSVASTI